MQDARTRDNRSHHRSNFCYFTKRYGSVHTAYYTSVSCMFTVTGILSRSVSLFSRKCCALNWKRCHCVHVSPSNLNEIKTPNVWSPLNLIALAIYMNIGACRAVGVPDKTWLRRIWCAIAESVCSHYTVRYTYVCACVRYISTHMLYRRSGGMGAHFFARLVLVIWVRMIRNNPGNTRVCPGLQAPI